MARNASGRRSGLRASPSVRKSGSSGQIRPQARPCSRRRPRHCLGLGLVRAGDDRSDDDVLLPGSAGEQPPCMQAARIIEWASPRSSGEAPRLALFWKAGMGRTWVRSPGTSGREGPGNWSVRGRQPTDKACQTGAARKAIGLLEALPGRGCLAARSNNRKNWKSPRRRMHRRLASISRGRYIAVGEARASSTPMDQARRPPPWDQDPRSAYACGPTGLVRRRGKAMERTFGTSSKGIRARSDCRATVPSALPRSGGRRAGSTSGQSDFLAHRREQPARTPTRAVDFEASVPQDSRAAWRSPRAQAERSVHVPAALSKI